MLQGEQGLLTFSNVPGIFSCQIFCKIEVRTLSLRDNPSTGCWYLRSRRRLSRLSRCIVLLRGCLSLGPKETLLSSFERMVAGVDSADNTMVLYRKNSCSSITCLASRLIGQSRAPSDQHSQTYTAASRVTLVRRPEHNAKADSDIQLVKQTRIDSWLSCRSHLNCCGFVHGGVCSVRAGRASGRFRGRLNHAAAKQLIG
jgi:hypothetical protein